MQSASVEKLLKTPIEQVPLKQIRHVKGLKWAELRDHGPFPGKQRNRNAKACVKKGKSYERTVLREVRRLDLKGEICFQQWIMFADENGLGWAQPDLYVLLPDLVLLMECKLSQTRDAEEQLTHLYLPLLREIYQQPVLKLEVFKHLRVTPNRLVDGPEDFLSFPRPEVHTWHYIGN